MIIVINSQGGLVSIQDEDLFQGSTNLNIINLLAPFSDSVVWKAVFIMPDGSYKPDNLDGYLFQSSMSITENLNAWKLPITFPISQEYGVVTMQLRGMIEDTIVCTTSVKFTIQKGVPYASNFEELSDKDQLLQMIADVKALVNNKVDIVKYVYEQAQGINENTVGIYYVYDSDNKKYIPKTLPQDYDESATYYELENTGTISNIDSGLSFTYTDNKNNQSMTLKIEKDKATLNGKQVVIFDNLTADNISYDNSATNIDADNVNDAIDTLQTSIDEVESMVSSGQVVEIGDITIETSDWVLVDNIYQYQFTNAELKDASVQFVVITPNITAINNLNDSDILVYPEIDMYQQSESAAVAVIKVDKKPMFDIEADVKIYSSILTANTRGIKANQISFNSTTDIPETNVQSAILQVQDSLNNFETQYNADKSTFATLDDNGKIPESQLPLYVDDVIEGYLYNSQFYEEESHTTVITPLSGKIYIDLLARKEYMWGGTQYSIISPQLGETEETAYAGNKGKQNADNISNILNGTTAVPKATNSILKSDGTYNGFTMDTDNNVLKIGDIVVPQKILVFSDDNGRSTYNDDGNVNVIALNFNIGETYEIEYSVGTSQIVSGTGYRGSHEFVKIKISELGYESSAAINAHSVNIARNECDGFLPMFGTVNISFRETNPNIGNIKGVHISKEKLYDWQALEQGVGADPSDTNNTYIYKIWKIIE